MNVYVYTWSSIWCVFQKSTIWWVQSECLWSFTIKKKKHNNPKTSTWWTVRTVSFIRVTLKATPASTKCRLIYTSQHCVAAYNSSAKGRSPHTWSWLFVRSSVQHRRQLDRSKFWPTMQCSPCGGETRTFLWLNGGKVNRRPEVRMFVVNPWSFYHRYGLASGTWSEML